MPVLFGISGGKGVQARSLHRIPGSPVNPDLAQKTVAGTPDAPHIPAEQPRTTSAGLPSSLQSGMPTPLSPQGYCWKPLRQLRAHTSVHENASKLDRQAGHGDGWAKPLDMFF